MKPTGVRVSARAALVAVVVLGGLFWLALAHAQWSSLQSSSGAVNSWTAAAADFTVTKTADTADGTCDADCSLREAIIAANANPGADTIAVPAGIYTLTIAGAGEDAGATGDLDITDDLTITGDGAAATIIDGGGLDRVLDITGDFTVEISGVAIRHGNPPDGPSLTGYGGGIYNSGDLALVGTIISDNSTSGFAGGGGIFNGGMLGISNSAISDNTAPAGGGGGILNYGSLIIIGSVIDGNVAIQSGGIAGNVVLINSTVSGNVACQGGGITEFENEVILNNATITGNIARQCLDFPGGGGGLVSLGFGITAKNTVIAGNTDDSGLAPDCYGWINSEGHNLIEDLTGCTIGGDTTGNITGQDPLLSPLADNGGSTLTHALLAGSPAIDAGSPDCPPPDTDQRGVARPLDGDGDTNAICDIGAYEFEPPPTELGDVNCDGAVNVVDALFVLQYEVGLRVDSGGCPLPTEPPPLPAIGWLNASLPACDVNDDAACNVVDALFILQCEVGMPPGADMPFCLAAVQVTQGELGPRTASWR